MIVQEFDIVEHVLYLPQFCCPKTRVLIGCPKISVDQGYEK